MSLHHDTIFAKSDCLKSALVVPAGGGKLAVPSAQIKISNDDTAPSDRGRRLKLTLQAANVHCVPLRYERLEPRRAARAAVVYGKEYAVVNEEYASAHRSQIRISLTYNTHRILISFTVNTS